MTIEELRNVLSPRSKKLLNDNVVNVLNNIEEQEDHDFSEAYRNNFMSYSRVLENPQYTMDSYLSAVKYVSYRLMNYNIIDAYMMTFPDRYQRLMDKYSDMGDEAWLRANKISSYASIYNQGDLVTEILTQAIVPPSILNMDLFQEALNESAHLMKNARSEMVRQQAAKTLLDTLKPAEAQKIELEVGLKENEVISELRKVTQQLAIEQQNSISAGSSTSTDICDMTIVEVEIEEDV